MKIIISLTIILLSFGCATNSPNVDTRRRAVDAAIDSIVNAASDLHQAEAIQNFYSVTAQVIEDTGLSDYSVLLFDRQGRLLKPGEGRGNYGYVLFIDLSNKPGLFVPFLVKPQGSRSENAVLARRI